MKNLISIILPVYKVRKEYIKQCIDSIKKQTYSNFEVICIFDGSDSKTIKHCKEYIGKDKRFNCVSRDNKGVSYTRNEGIARAKGEWITFIDADDWFENNALESFVNNMVKDDSIDFYILRAFINGKKNYCAYQNNHIIDQEKKVELFQSAFGTKYGKYSYCESVWKNFYKKSALLANGIEFPEKIKIGEDMIFNYRIWSKCREGYFINSSIYNYRINDESVMNSDYNQLKEKYEVLFPTFEKEIQKLDKRYTENYSIFIIKQIKRFYLHYGNDNKTFSEISELIKNKYYQEKIKVSKIGTLDLKNGVFLFALKIKSKKLLKTIIKIYNK